jgi:hypothetical protein
VHQFGDQTKVKTIHDVTLFTKHDVTLFTKHNVTLFTNIKTQVPVAIKHSLRHMTQHPPRVPALTRCW